MTATFEGSPVTTASLRLPRAGGWSANLRVVGDLTSVTKGTFEFDGLELPGPIPPGSTVSYTGDVISARLKDGVTNVFMVGGKWVNNTLNARSWSVGSTVSTVAAEVTAGTGTSVYATLRQDMLFKVLQKWQLVGGETVGSALSRLTDLTGDGVWRIDKDGQTLFTVDLFVAFPNLDGSRITGQDDMSVTLLTDGLPGRLLPGNRFEGTYGGLDTAFDIQETTLRLDPKRGYTVTVADTSGNSRERSVIDSQVRSLLLGRTWSGTIILQNPIDGTCSIEPDDDAISGFGIQNVPIWLGIPGTVTVPPNTRCMFVYQNGDPQLPVITNFEDGSVTLLKLAGGGDLVALSTQTNDNFQAIKDLFTNWVVVANDGGAALKTASATLLFGDVAADSVEAE